MERKNGEESVLVIVVYGYGYGDGGSSTSSTLVVAMLAATIALSLSFSLSLSLFLAHTLSAPINAMRTQPPLFLGVSLRGRKTVRTSVRFFLVWEKVSQFCIFIIYYYYYY